MNEMEARKAAAVAGWGNQVSSNHLKYALEEIDRLRAKIEDLQKARSGQRDD